MLFVVRCPGCGARGSAPCPACAAELRPAPALPPPPGLATCAALLAYEGVGRELVARLKYRNWRAPLPRLAAAMAALVDPGALDAITWAPTSARRRRARGFDQAELLGGAVARRLGLPCLPLLRRADGPAQTGLTGPQRRRGPALSATAGVPPRVLVVDDVITTGATMREAAVALRAAGALEVRGLAAARTPPRAYTAPWAACGSVVASRSQPQAKRPT